jgi:lipopolysaccharide/colanic/teichoic acid biosynthesis glycosyltransferase
MAIIVLLIRLTSKGPALFRQKRIGLNGRKFTMYKFRTMYNDAEQRWSESHLKNEMHGPAFKMKDDPRITPLGALLRKYSLDELPQLWNVVIGDMSLVGPRPPLPLEVSLYRGWQRRRLSMRPGITCIWQVTGRNRITDFNEWVKMDLDYIDRWSLLLDFQILLKTFPAVIKGTGL